MARSSSQTRRTTAWEFARGNALTLTLLAALLFGCLVVAFHGSTYRTVGALLWSLGFAAAGVLLGFIFAVPRPSRAPALVPVAAAPVAVAGGNGAPPPDPAAAGNAPPASVSAGAAAAANAGMEINTNLMEISDWLTKIIVGVGLVELKQLPAHAESVARFMAPSLHDSLGVPLAGAIMLYFSVLGFLGGYLLTRIYISQWFRWADEQTRGQVQLESGRVMDVDELTRLQQPVIEDLQQQVAALVQRHAAESQPPSAAAAAPAAARPALRILWADDRPQNNTLQVNMLEKEGHRVDTVLDTSQALAALQANHYDVLITDMHRTEGGKENPTAGLDLLRTAKERQPELTALVFCSRFAVQRNGEDARRMGAELVTDSGTALLATLRGKAQALR